MTRWTLTAAIVSLALALTLIGLIIGASLEKSLGAGLGRLVDDLWGVTTLVDLTVGLIVIGAWICVLERRPGRCIPWLIGLALLGNLTTIIYVLVRALRADSFSEIFAPRPASHAAPCSG